MFRYNYTNNYLAAIFTCFVLSCATLPMLFDDEFQAAEFALPVRSIGFHPGERRIEPANGYTCAGVAGSTTG